MTTMIVIYTASRDIKQVVANVTLSQAGLVIREAMALPSLKELKEGEGVIYTLPTLVVGRGYQAQSSEGHVSVTLPDLWGGPEGAPCTGVEAAVVGHLPFGRSLRPCRPVFAWLIGPCKVEAVQTASNSNPRTAKGVERAVAVSATLQPTSVFITEGQSDWNKVFRLTPSTGVDPVELYCDIDLEHRVDMFGWEGVVTSAYRAKVTAAKRRWVGKPIDFVRRELESVIREDEAWGIVFENEELGTIQVRVVQLLDGVQTLLGAEEDALRASKEVTEEA